jgi:hypothetical protein
MNLARERMSLAVSLGAGPVEAIRRTSTHLFKPYHNRDKQREKRGRFQAVGEDGGPSI